MEYITAAEAADKWDISLRQVQRLLTASRIPDAQKYHRSWMIPADAAKPGDPRFEKLPEKSLSSDLADIIAAICKLVPRDNPRHIIETVGEERLRLIAESVFAYALGDFQRTIRCFQKNEGDDAAKLVTCMIAIPAAISAGDYPLFLEIEIFLKSIVLANIGDNVTALAELALAAGYISAMAPGMIPGWLKDGNFKALPSAMRPDAANLRAKYFQCVGNFEVMLAVAQTALAFCDSEDKTSITNIYLRLDCAIALYELERPDEAERYLLDLMHICLPHGFITPFAELVSNFGGLIEQLLKREYPACYNAVIAQWNRTIPNWIIFHNRFTKNNITRILSLREGEIALLAARGVPYKKIAEQFNLSTGTLKNIMSIICEKLFITGRDRRKDLAKFVSMTRKS